MKAKHLPDSLPRASMLEEYRIERVLGRGSFGFTYLAYDPQLKKHVAIKEFFPEGLVTRQGQRVVLADEGKHAVYQFGRDAFLSEARLLARLRHPNIVAVSRYFSANETAYYVMDYEEGETLAEHLRRRRQPLDDAGVWNLLRQLLSALLSLHEKKYLHRDIKPANVMLRRNGSAVLIDFGTARMEFGTAGNVSHMALTPGYAPLEQYYEDAEQGPWSDLYALGATLYRALSLERPPDSLARQRALEKGLSDPLVPAAILLKNRFSPNLLSLVDWMLKLDATQRPQSAQSVLQRIGKISPGVAPARTRGFSYQPRKLSRDYKILFVGPVGAGKTTAVSALSDTGCISTDQAASDMTKTLKANTTVAMDYGIMNLGEGERVHLFGAPGQERFDFMWEILQKGALGLVILIDHSRRAPLDDLAFYLGRFSALLKNTKMVVGINFMERRASPDLDDYVRLIRDSGHAIPPPVFEVDARNRKDMAMLIEALLVSIDPRAEYEE